MSMVKKKDFRLKSDGLIFAMKDGGAQLTVTCQSGKVHFDMYMLEIKVL